MIILVAACWLYVSGCLLAVAVDLWLHRAFRGNRS